MTYIKEILWYLSWPLLIVISYQAIKWALKKFEQKEPELRDSQD